MTEQHRNVTGFTLVEILIVVVILGILASIVVPQFSNASEEAKSSSAAASLLQTVRSQLELYQIQHNGDYPTIDEMWTNMITKTDAFGEAGTDFGPYLQKAPTNPFTGTSVTIAGSTHDMGSAKSDGWVYDEDSGSVYLVGFDEDTGEYTAP